MKATLYLVPEDLQNQILLAPYGQSTAVDLPEPSPANHSDKNLHRQSTLGVAAASLVDQGIPVFPCLHQDNEHRKAKSPLVHGGFKSASADKDKVAAWWKKWPNAAIGMPTGAGTGTFVLDIDNKDGRDGWASLRALEEQYGALPATKRVATPSGGEHIYFAMPEGADVRCSSDQLGQGIDVRGEGGYVLVPPTTLYNQDELVGRYREDTTDSLGAITTAPDWLLRRLTQPREQQKPHTRRAPTAHSSWAEAWLQGQCQAVSDASQGSRNDRLNRAAFAAGQILRMGSLDRTQIEDALLAAARTSGLGESEAKSTIKSGIEAGLAKPSTRPFFVDHMRNGDVDARSLHNVVAFLDWQGVTARWNAFEGNYELTGLNGHTSYTDRAITELWGNAQEIGFRVDRGFLRDCLEAVAIRCQVHPVQEFFGAIEEQWDGIERLDLWLVAYLKAKDTPYVHAVGAKLLIAAIRRIRKPGTKFDQLLILEGEQGTGKSTALKVLARHENWFTDCISLTHDSKIMIEQTQGKLIVEVPELKGMKRAEVEHVKATLSRTHDRARKAYARVSEEVPRQFILVGTTNTEKNGECWYLKDTTGNRRFWPVGTGEIDLTSLRRDRDQLWAEAAQREASGESLELPRNLWEEARSEQAARMERDPWLTELTNELDGLEGKLLTSDARRIVSPSLERWGPSQDDRLGRAMRELGWERRQLREADARPYFYTKGPSPWEPLVALLNGNALVCVCKAREAVDIETYRKK